MNKGTFVQPGGGAKDRSLTKIRYHPGTNIQYVRDMLASQKGDTPSREVSETEEISMMNQIINNKIRR